MLAGQSQLLSTRTILTPTRSWMRRLMTVTPLSSFTGASCHCIDGALPFNQHGYVHMNMTRKRKPGQPV
eukprot:14807746-Alexandrium_andersonii.AAC.1